MSWRSGWRAPAGVCLLLAIIHTWPLATAPGTLSRNDNADAQLNAWALAWIAHQLPRDPAHLFDGNIFYPERRTLAFSEPLIVPALMGAPLRWAGGSPVLVLNVVMLLGFALTAFAGYALIVEWTGDRAAGLLAGSMFAFNTHTLTRLAHVQAQHAWGLPLALLAADRLVTHHRWRDAIWLAIWMTAMAYTSGYLIVFGAVMIALVLIFRIPDWWPHAKQVISAFALAAVVAGVAVLPVYLPYRAVARDLHMVRPLALVKEFSATPLGYLAAAGRIHFATWSGVFFKDPVDSFFPGFVVIVLACLAVYWTLIRTGRPAPLRGYSATSASGEMVMQRHRVVMLVAIAITGFVLSLGIRTPIYGWLYYVFPPMQGLRAAARFGNLFLLGMALLAGLGLAALRPRLSPRWATSIVAALVILANLESLRAPFVYRRFDGIPAIYSLLAREPGPVVLVEAPYYPAHAFFENGPYMLNATAHWRPLMNGYSGYVPDSYRRNADSFWYFPEDYAIDAMRRAGATHVMIHPERFGDTVDDMWRKVNASPHLERIAITPSGLALYRLK
jgi:hypothetical protein